MGMYDAERNLVVSCPNFAAACGGCGRVMLKKQMITILSKRGYGNAHTIGHLCEGCYAAMCERLEWEAGQ